MREAAKIEAKQKALEKEEQLERRKAKKKAKEAKEKEEAKKKKEEAKKEKQAKQEIKDLQESERRTKIAEAAAARRERGKPSDAEAELAKLIQEAKQGFEKPEVSQAEVQPEPSGVTEKPESKSLENGIIVLDDE